MAVEVSTRRGTTTLYAGDKMRELTSQGKWEVHRASVVDDRSGALRKPAHKFYKNPAALCSPAHSSRCPGFLHRPRIHSLTP